MRDAGCAKGKNKCLEFRRNPFRKPRRDRVTVAAVFTSSLQSLAHEQYLECFCAILFPGEHVDSSKPITDHVCVVDAVILGSNELTLTREPHFDILAPCILT